MTSLEPLNSITSLPSARRLTTSFKWMPMSAPGGTPGGQAPTMVSVTGSAVAGLGPVPPNVRVKVSSAAEAMPSRRISLFIARLLWPEAGHRTCAEALHLDPLFATPAFPALRDRSAHRRRPPLGNWFYLTIDQLSGTGSRLNQYGRRAHPRR